VGLPMLFQCVYGCQSLDCFIDTVFWEHASSASSLVHSYTNDFYVYGTSLVNPDIQIYTPLPFCADMP